MLLVKTSNGQVEQFPYTLGNLRRNNPQTSFPKQVPDSVLAAYDVYPVQAVPAPAVDSKTHRVVQSVAQSGEGWTQTWTVQELSKAQAEDNVRAHRNRLLSDTDWTALSDNTMTSEMATYRQALRDITAQAGFPYSVEWPTKPE
jgi:hypothetical protein